MKYLLLIYQNPVARQALDAAELELIFADANVLMAELMETGEFIGGEGLADPPALFHALPRRTRRST